MPFDLNAKQVFLTYPHVKNTYNDVYQALLSKWDPEKIVVAHEFHADGTDHIHVYLKHRKVHRTKDCRYYDILGNHGKYEGARSWKNVLKYCTKEGTYRANFDVAALIAARQPTRLEQGKELLAKRPLLEVVEEYPNLLFGYNRLKLDVESYFSDKGSTKDCLYQWLPNPWGLLLPSRVHKKQRHYWLWSTYPNVGKTYHFARPLAEFTRTIIRTGSEPYWNVKPDTELVILDEYNVAIFKFHELNSMADGTYGFRRFQLGVLHLNNPLIIVLSNSSIRDIYPNRYDLICARFKEFKLD